MSDRHASSAPDLDSPVGRTDHVLGPRHAPVAVIEYGDFECPTCKQAAPTVRLLLQRFSNRIMFAFRHFPLEGAHPHALAAAEASECAGGQGKFWEMHDLLFTNQQHLSLKYLREYATQLELDMARYEAEMNDHVYLQRIREHQDSGRRSYLRATPGFFVNGRIQDVSFGLENLFDAVDRAIAAKRS